MSVTKIFHHLILLASLVLLIPLAQAEDIDIYDANSGSASNPNILIILDNSSNWATAAQNWPTDTSPPVACGNDCSKQGYYELKALRTLISGLVASYGDASGNVPINVGLQLFNNTTSTRGGGYIRSAVMPMTTANRTLLISTLDTMIGNFNTETASSSVQYGAALFDAFKYFGGFTNPANATTDLAPTTNPSYSGVPVFGTKFWGTNNGDGSKPDFSRAYNPASASSSGDYVPISAASCGKDYIVFIGNGFPSKDDNSSSDMSQVLKYLTNPASPPSTIAQFDLTNYSAGTSCSDVVAGSSGCYNPTALCTAALPANTDSAFYQCSQSSCSGNDKKIQACNVVATSGQPSGNATGRYADEFADFLYRTDVNSLTGQQNVTTYVIDVYKDKQDLDQTALMRNMAKYGGGKYYAASDTSQLSKAFDSILAEIQSVNSVFASSSLPVSVNTQGTYLNQVFVGMFRPDTSSQPRWFGNLKQYQFKIFDTTLRLADFSSPAIEAISAQTGFITPCANSAWSSDTGSYWQYNANSAGLCNSATKFSDAPDGATVEKGGAAQRLRGVTSAGISTNYSTRALKTCDSTNCTTLTDFNTSNSTLTAAALGVASGNETSLINWVRGQDVDNENNTTSFPNSITNEVRPSVHGGVVHSQPAVVDYGGTTGVVSYYGADDGVFHAVNANKTINDGNEYWGFIAPETDSKLHRLRDNSPLIKFPSFSSSITPTPTPKDYYFDGSIGVFQRVSTTNTVWIYPTMRRGGRAIYAFDVSTPTSPALKWRKGCYTNSTTDDSNCATGWTAIGQTWSKPQVTYLSGYVDSSNNPKPVLVFGGGYDTCEDTDSQTRCTTTPRKGANIWFVDADTGAIIRTYPTNYSVPGEITLLTDAVGNATYAYAADTGGYVYRVNVGTYDGSTFSSTWTNNSSAANITIASLSETGQARKFLFAPDVIVYAGYNEVAIGSGDREHPLNSNYACNNFASTGILNQFYIIKDRPVAYPVTPITPTDLTDVTTNLTISQTSIGTNGLRFDLVDPATPTKRCEQTVNKSLTIGGVTYFGTNAPKSSSEISTSCGINLGNARGYAVNFLTGAPIANNSRSVLYKNGGLPPSPVGGIVDINGTKVPFCIGCTTPGDPNPSPLQGSPVKINPVAPRQRLYWYLESD